ncbi:MAG TPA: MFS transporter, partial [Candidatus Hydrogenedentes bacterium]|nr:MFS transporter [Candidatus Hydrogenedentota bacterium]
MIFTAYGHVLARDPPFPVYWEVTTLPGSTGTFKHAGTDVTRSVYQGASMTTELTADHRYWRRRILISTYMGYVGFYFTRKVFTLCKIPIVEELGWELGDTAHIWTAFLIAYMIGQFLSSYTGRRWGPRVLLLGGLGLSIVCSIIFGFTNSYATFLVFMAFNGLFQAAGWPACVGAVSEWLRVHERGRIIGIWTTNHILGSMLVKTLTGMFLGMGGLFLGLAGWRWAFFGCTLIAFGLWWLIYFWQRNKPENVGLTPLVSHEETEQQSIEASKEEHV